jgi:hypothetical protein
MQLKWRILIALVGTELGLRARAYLKPCWGLGMIALLLWPVLIFLPRVPKRAARAH